jgi:hypothetical protein
MKKTGLILLFSIAVFVMSSAQNIDDALRYSQVFYSGTARFMSMGGAFTALGGDISTLSQNPAGLGVFRSSEITVSPQLFQFKSSVDFNNTNSKDYMYNFNLGQAGIVTSIIKPEQGNILKTLNFGYSFSRTNNFNQSINIEGTLNSSLLDYFAQKLYGVDKNDLSQDYLYDSGKTDLLDAFLAWDTYLLDTLPGSNNSYGTVYSTYGDDPSSVYGQHMRRLISNSGSTGEHSLSLGGNYSDKIFFGATFGFTSLNYESKYEHLESVSEPLPIQFTDFNYAYYVNNTGTGYSFKFGAIYKPIEILRIGLAFHSPTIYRITETVSDNMAAHFSYRVDPYYQNNTASRFTYALTTPFRVTLGGALQIQKLAIISADYEFVDYSTAKFHTVGDDTYDYSVKNYEIKHNLRSTSNLRLGAEFRLNNLYFRGGYSLYGKPYASGDINDNLNYNLLSFGVGFRERNISADFAFTSLMNSQNYELYSSAAGTPVANMNLSRNMFTITFGYKFGY